MTDFFCANIFSKPLPIETPADPMLYYDTAVKKLIELDDQAEVDTYKRLLIFCQG